MLNRPYTPRSCTTTAQGNKNTVSTSNIIAARLRSRRELRQRGEPSSDAHHERQGAGVR